MAANKQQGSYFGLFLAGATVLCSGFAFYDSGTGKALLAIGALGVIGSMFGYLGIKPLEGKTALKDNPLSMKLIGAGVCLLGWILTLAGLHITDSTGGRIIFALLGIVVSFVGMAFILPAAFNKNAVWKGESGASDRTGMVTAKPSMEQSR
jgi:Ni,Fe-hydrogenase I cytochrome b subunit